jgi:hypothetical protein
MARLCVKKRPCIMLQPGLELRHCQWHLPGCQPRRLSGAGWAAVPITLARQIHSVIHLFLGRSVSQCQGVIQTSYPLFGVSDGHELLVRNAPGATSISLSRLWCGKPPWVQMLASSFIFVQVGTEALGEQAHKVSVVLGVREAVPSSKPTFRQLQTLP